MSLFNSTTARPLRSKKPHWSFRAPDKRNPKLKSYLAPRLVATVKPASKGIYSFNGETCTSFEGVKTVAKAKGYGILRMGIVSVNL